MAEPSCRGQVVALMANYCWVGLDQPGPAGQQRLLCTRRTRLAKAGQAICVGDWVQVDGIDWASERGAVAAVEPRQRSLERPAVANVTRVVVVVALAEPELDAQQLTRFLITAERSGAEVDLVFSKADLLPQPQVEAWVQRVAAWGYDAMAVSSATGAGLGALRQRLSAPGLAVLCGPSGVGKSSLLNALIPELALRVAAVSGRLQRGRHTTRHVELYGLAPGALLADTPGFNRPALPASLEELAACFPELGQRLSQQPCQFPDCAHQGEQGCAMGSHWDRQQLYGQCLEDLALELRRRPQIQRQRDAGSLRQRGDRVEPRLAAQYRQASRRGGRQQIRQQSDAELSHPDQEDSD